jgi:hypothetical protein
MSYERYYCFSSDLMHKFCTSYFKFETSVLVLNHYSLTMNAKKWGLVIRNHGQLARYRCNIVVTKVMHIHIWIMLPS